MRLLIGRSLNEMLVYYAFVYNISLHHAYIVVFAVIWHVLTVRVALQEQSNI